jgi:hypothetical protein
LPFLIASWRFPASSLSCQVHTSAAVTGVERRGTHRVVTFSVGGSEMQVTAAQVLVVAGTELVNRSEADQAILSLRAFRRGGG